MALSDENCLRVWTSGDIMSLAFPLKDLHSSLAFKDYYQQDITKPFIIDRYFDFVIHLAAYNITNVGDQGCGALYGR